MLRAPGAGGQHQVGCGEGALLATQPATGASGADFPDPVGALLESGHGGHRNNLGASGFRKAEIILQQRVLGAVTTAGHAAAAFQTAGAGRAGTAEVWVGRRLAGVLGAGGTEEHPDP